MASQDKTISSESILTHVRQLKITHQDQLLKKFQLLHFTVKNNLSFSVHNELATFEKDTHKVNLGSLFLSDKNSIKMTLYLLNSLLHDDVVKPLNEGRNLHFSLLYDGSSSAPINDERELYFIKTSRNGVPQFDVLLLQQPDDTNAAGLHVALQNSIESAKFTFYRKNREVGVGPDGASANKSLY